jgi:hypothetical protein
MPIVDLEELFNALDGRDDTLHISLILFQAIMFAGTASVDIQFLLNAGYENRRAARAEYYTKIKVSHSTLTVCRFMELTLTYIPSCYTTLIGIPIESHSFNHSSLQLIGMCPRMTRKTHGTG